MAKRTTKKITGKRPSSINSIKLYIGDEMIRAPYTSRITGFVADEATKLWIKHISNSDPMQDLNLLVSKYQTAADKIKNAGNIIDADVLTDITDIDINQMMKLKSDVQTEERKFNIEFLKLFIDKLGCDPQIIEKWEDENFWKDQDIEEFAIKALYFRNKLRIDA